MLYLKKVLEADSLREFQPRKEPSVGQPKGCEAEMVTAACELEVPRAVEQAGCFFVDGAAGPQDLDVAFAPTDVLVLGWVRVQDCLGVRQEEVVDQGADFTGQADEGVAGVGVCEASSKEALEVGGYGAGEGDAVGLRKL